MIKEDKYYSHRELEAFASMAGFELKTHGTYSIGKRFVSLSDERDNVFSFVMTGDGIYTVSFQHYIERYIYISDGRHYIRVCPTELMGIIEYEIAGNAYLDEYEIVHISEDALEKIVKRIFS